MQFSDAVVKANEDYQSGFEDDPVGSTLKYGQAMKDASVDYANSMGKGSKSSKDSDDGESSSSRSSRKKKPSTTPEDGGLLPRQDSDDQTDQAADTFADNIENIDKNFKDNASNDPVGSTTDLGGKVISAAQDYAHGLNAGVQADRDQAKQQQQRRRERQFRRTETDDKIAAADSASDDLESDLQKADDDYLKGVTGDPVGSSVEYVSDVASAASTYTSKLSPAVRDSKNGKAQDFFQANGKRASAAAASASTDPSASKAQVYTNDMSQNLNRYTKKLKENSAKGGADVGTKDSKASSDYANSIKETIEMYENTLSSPVQ